MSNIKKFLAIILFAMSPMAIAGGGHDVVKDNVHLDMGDKASLQRGAKLFVNYCLSCHSAEYMRYNRVAEDLEIPVDLLKENLMFTTEKTGDLMKTTMPVKDAKAWFGVAPPDLTLVSRVRKPDWLYTYLRAFYLDESSPSGWNNSLFENVAMPHVMYELQGVQKKIGKIEDTHADTSGHGEDTGLGENQKLVGDTIFELVHPGKLNAHEFDDAMRDLTNFLAYMAEPVQMKRKKIGVYTILFLIVFLLLAIMLKQEYWRDIK